ncbi:MAG TPA: DUF4157 domain-containing protein [Kofleriaceae bacterium]|nr:DUF4157 domain-containing protein [Kofleriaceae bacterium]
MRKAVPPSSPSARASRARLEGEADRATSHARRGTRVRPNELSPALPARDLGGVGRPLPCGLRDRLERVFGADLAAVRVHQGPAAAAATRGIRGLASGTHVHLGVGEAVEAPHTWPVLVHEIAHVLQQTGRPAADGRIAATDRFGSEEPLAWDAPFSATPNAFSDQELLTSWSATAQARGDSASVDQIAALSNALGAAASPTAFWKERAQAVLSDRADPAFASGMTLSLALGDLAPLARSALYDGLKVHKQLSAAVRILERYDTIEAYVLEPEVYTRYVTKVGVDHVLDRIAELWDKLPLLGEARPNKALALTVAYLFGTFAQVQPLPIHDDDDATKRSLLVDDLDALVSKARTDGTYAAGELVISALQTIYTLEQYRVSVLAPPTDGRRLAMTDDAKLDERITVASNVVGWAKAVADKADAIRADTAVIPGIAEARYLLVRDWAPALGAAAAYVLDAWGLGDLAGAVARHADDKRAAARGLDDMTLHGIGYSKPEPFPGLAKDLLGHANALYARETDGSLPGPTAYRARIDTAISFVDNKILAIQGALVLRASGAWNIKDHPIRFDASGLGDQGVYLAQATWLIARLTAYRAQMDGYTTAADTDFKKAREDQVKALGITNWAGDDVRVMHRAHVAMTLIEIADDAGLDDLAERLRPILTADETLTAKTKQTDDVLAIAQDWTADRNAPISQLAKDMQGSPIQYLEELSPEQLVLFFQGDRYRRISDRIDTLLGGSEGQRFALDQVPIINQAHDAEQDSDLQPLRFKIPPDGFLYLGIDGREVTSATEPLRTPMWQLIQQHPITRVLVEPWKYWLVPVNQRDPDLVLWRIPDLMRIASRLRGVKEVDDLLAHYAAVDPQAGVTPPTSDELAKMDDATWWTWWVRLTTADPSSWAIALERKRAGELKTIPEINARLAELATTDVVAPEPVPTEQDLAGYDADTWIKWFRRLAWDVPAAVWEERNKKFRHVTTIDDTIARFSSQDAGSSATALTAIDVDALADDSWLALWSRVIAVAFSRRSQLGDLLAAVGFTGTLEKEKVQSANQMQDRQRAAFVHERERICRVYVLPLLDAYVYNANIGDKAQIKELNDRKEEERLAAEDALDALYNGLLNRILDDERAPHQAAALLRIAPKLRDKLVVEDDGKWNMRGWDLGVAVTWMPVIEETLGFLAKSPALDPWLRDDERPASTWIQTNLPDLQHTYDGLLEAITANQESFGIDAYGGDGTIENSGYVTELDMSRQFGPGHSIRIDGITWEILGVFETFRYHPSVKRGRALKPIKKSILKINGQVQDFDGTKELMRVSKDGDTMVIKNDDAGDDVLRELAFAVMRMSTIEQLQELADTLESGMMFAVGLALDILDLIPVEGEAAEVARIMSIVKLVIASKDWIDLAVAFIQDPGKTLETAWDTIKDSFSLEGVLTNLLLNPNLDFLTKIRSLIPAHGTPHASNSRIGRVLRRLEALGRGIAGALGRVVSFGHDIRDDVQAFVLEHLLLARVLGVVADNIRIIDDIKDVLSGDKPIDQIVFGFIKDRFMGIVDAIGAIRVPLQLLTMDDVVGFALDLVAKELGGKYALAYDVVKAVLQQLGAWDDVTKTIADGIVGALHFDPTVELGKWLNFIDVLLKPYLETAQGYVWDLLSWIYDAIPWHDDHLPKPKPISIEKEGDQFLDTAAMPRTGSGPEPGFARIELAGGRPLDDDARAGFERQFGQDLSHVRVHTGTDAMRATRAAGARALTTGSHILLAPDVTPDSDTGDRVMRHELVHVLQQTGPRPFGSAGVAQTGEPGRGLRIDPAAEETAHRVSTRTTPAYIPPMRTRGYQPDMLTFGQRFVDYLTHLERAKKEIQRVEATGSGTDGVLIAKEVRDHVKNVGPGLTKWIEDFGESSIQDSERKTFGPVADKIKAWLEQCAPIISDAIEDLAEQASETEKLRDDSNESPMKHLKVETFRMKLIRFIAGATGCDIAIDFAKNPDQSFNTAAPIEHAELRAMNLALIPEDKAGKPLWDALMSTFSTDNANLRANVRILMFARGYTDGTWDENSFALDGKFMQQINTAAGKTAGMTLPDAKSFWYGKGTPPSSSTKWALWIGEHRDGTHHGSPDRQSHHTTQFLLVQYFEMDHKKRPFPEPRTADVVGVLENELGLTMDSSKTYVDRVANITVGKLDESGRRGGGMPAILIAAVTHRRGVGLHIAPIVQEVDEEDEQPTQGGTVHQWFKDALSEEAGPTADGYWQAVDAIKNAKNDPVFTNAAVPSPTNDPLDWLRANAGKLSTAIPAAMKKVYGSMKDVMLPALLPALQQLETTWYQQLAIAQQKSITSGDYHVTDTMMTDVAEKAKDNNHLIMEERSNWA